MKADWIVFRFGENEYPCVCYRCGEELRLPLPQPLSIASVAMKEFAKIHQRCVLKDPLVIRLREKFPQAPEREVWYFLSRPNEYIEGQTPRELGDPERMESLFDRFLHPADVF